MLISDWSSDVCSSDLTTMHIETFMMKGGAELHDTLYYTHHGPVVYHEESETNYSSRVPVGYAMRWAANETDGADVLTFHYLNRAADYDDYRTALTYFTAPAQHFVFSSHDGDIAITSNGNLTLKWKGQGKYLLDGTLRSEERRVGNGCGDKG